MEETETTAAVADPDSLVSRVEDFFLHRLTTIDGFKLRRSQLDMAIAVAEHLTEGGPLAVEAGTGTGKSLAYLVPLMLRNSPEETPAIVATKTVQLQDQLLKKDIPILQGLLSTPRKVVQAKGWSNYVCIRKVETPDEQALRELGPYLPELRRQLINSGGKLTRQEAVLARRHWERIKADPLDCQKRNCPHFSSCGLFAERRELETAEIIVTNHAFLLTDLRLQREGRGLLPKGDVLVVDEAHRLDDVATEHLAVRFDPDRVYSIISSPLLNGNDGWLAACRFTFLMALPEVDFLEWSGFFDQVVLLNLKNLENLCSDIFVELQMVSQGQPRLALRPLLFDSRGERLANLCSELCMGLEEASSGMQAMCRDYEEKFEASPPPELLRLSQSLAGFGYDLQFLLECDSSDWVYLVESDPTSLVARPVDNAEALRVELFETFHSCIVTSASLRVNDSFHFFKSRSGLTDGTSELVIDSPFKVAENTFLGFSTSGPNPGSPEYPAYLAPWLISLAANLGGRLFLLTTSHRRVQEFHALLSPELATYGIEVLAQGEEPAPQLLKRFSSAGRYVLIGVDTFWEGVDIPGERLSCVVMTRLPFPVPSDELFQARSELIESAGGNAFYDLSMPLVGLKLKQGFGRLLRTESDKGIFLLTDPRASTKSYGNKLLKNIPCAGAYRGPTEEVFQRALEWSYLNLDFCRTSPHEDGLTE